MPPVQFGAAHGGGLSSPAVGDDGARSFLQAGSAVVVDLVDPGVILNGDTPEACEAVRGVHSLAFSGSRIRHSAAGTAAAPSGRRSAEGPL